MHRTVDAQDRRVITLLGDSGRMSLAEVAQRAGASRATVASRLKRLTDDGILRVAGLVDIFRISGLTTALVGLTVDRHRLEEKLEQIAALPAVTWTAVVTGRYDIMAEIATEDGVSGLYDFLNLSLREVGGINSSEMFVVMKSKNRWVLLPASMRRRWGGQAGPG